MAIGLMAVSAFASGSTSLAIPHPTGPVAGEMFVMTIATKPTTATLVVPSGWTLRADYSSTFGTHGNGTGPQRMWVLTKPTVGGESGTVAVTITGGNASVGMMTSISSPTTGNYFFKFAVGEDTTSGTAFSAVCTPVDGDAAGWVQAGMKGLVWAAKMDDVGTYSAHSLTSPGLTLTCTEAAEPFTTTGFDIATALCTSGTITGTQTGPNLTYSATLGAAGYGGVIVIIMHDVAWATNYTGTATLSGSGSLSTSATPQVARSVSLSGSGSLSPSVTPKPARAMALSGDGSLSLTRVPSVARPVALSGVGSLGAGAVPSVASPVSLSGSGTLSVDAGVPLDPYTGWPSSWESAWPSEFVEPLDALLTSHLGHWDFSNTESITTSSGGMVIDAIADQTSNNLDLTKVGVTGIGTLNGLSALRVYGGGTPGGMVSAAFTPDTQPYTTWAAFRMESIPDGAAHVIVGNKRGSLRTMSGKFSIDIDTNIQTSVNADLAPHVMVATFNGGTSKVWIDGTSVWTGGVSNLALELITLGFNNWNGLGTNAEHADVTIGETGVYPDAMSDSDVGLLSDYLMEKWVPEVTEEYSVSVGLSGSGSLGIAGGRTAYSAYRLDVVATRSTGPTGLVQLSEFQFLVGGVRQVPSSTDNAGSMDMPEGEEQHRLSDNNTATKWLNFNHSNGYPYFIFPTPITADGIRIATANDSPERDPVAFDVYGSNDTVTGTPGTWTLIASFNWSTDPGRTSYVPDFVIPPQLSGGTGIPSLTQAVGFSGAGTLSASRTPSVARAISLSGDGTLSAARTPSVARAVALSGDGTLSAARVLSIARAIALSGSGTLSASRVPSFARPVALSGDGTLSITRIPSFSRPIALSGSGTLTAFGTPSDTEAISLSGSGTLSAVGSGSEQASSTPSLSGSGQLNTSSTSSLAAAVSLSGSGQLSTTRTVAFSRAVALTGSGTLTALGIPSPARAVPLSGSGTLTSSGSPAIGRAVSLSGEGTLTALGAPNDALNLSGSGTLSITASPSFVRAIGLSGAGTLTTTRTVAFTRAVALTGSGTLTAGRIVSFSRAVAFTGSGTLTTTRFATFPRAIALSGSGTLTAIGSAAVFVQWLLGNGQPMEAFIIDSMGNLDPVLITRGG
jgi:hypothetical protein